MLNKKELHELLDIKPSSELCLKEESGVTLDVALFEYVNEDLMEMS